MGADRALFFLHQLVWTAMAIGAPLLVATLIVGLVISVVQVATQIQEITLSYVPKLLTAAIMLILFGGWMLGRLTDFATTIYHQMGIVADKELMSPGNRPIEICDGGKLITGLMA